MHNTALHVISAALCSQLLLVSLFITSCNGQTRTNLPKGSVSELKQPKLIKTQGTGPYHNVHCGLQDKAGNLWFGTTGEGVYRYDGKSFTNFTMQDGLSNNFVWSILEDKAGNIWFGTADGACRYDGKKFISIPITVIQGDNFLSYNSPTSKLSVDAYGNPSEENAVWRIIQDKTGIFWFGTTDGIYRYDGKIFTHFSHNDGVINSTGLPINKVESILEDKTGNIWFGGRLTKGLFRFDGKSLISFKPDGANWVRPVFEDKAGIIWFSTRTKSVYRYDGKTFTSFGEKELNSWVLSMAEDKSGNLWFSTWNGLVYFDGKSFTKYTMKEGLSNNDVFSVTLDKSGNLWVGTRGMGLCRYDGKTFTNFSENESKH